MLGIVCYVFEESHRKRTTHMRVALVERVLDPDSIVHMCVSDSLIEGFVREGVVIYFVPVLSLKKSKCTVTKGFFCILGTDREL